MTYRVRIVVKCPSVSRQMCFYADMGGHLGMNIYGFIIRADCYFFFVERNKTSTKWSNKHFNGRVHAMQVQIRLSAFIGHAGVLGQCSVWIFDVCNTALF